MNIKNFEPYKFLEEMLIKEQKTLNSGVKQTVFFDDIEDKYPTGSDFANTFTGFLYEYKEGLYDFEQAIEDNDERWNRYENYKNYFEQLLSLSDEEVLMFIDIFDDLQQSIKIGIPEDEKIQKISVEDGKWKIRARTFFEKIYHDLYHTDTNFKKDLVKYLYSL